MFGFKCFYGKDGGPESKVFGYFLESKKLFSVVLLRFEEGTRESYHSHAFNSISWLLRGRLVEKILNKVSAEVHRPGLRPIMTYRKTFHQVRSVGTSWVLSFRGPWSRRWTEYDPRTKKVTQLTWGRKEGL